MISFLHRLENQFSNRFVMNPAKVQGRTKISEFGIVSGWTGGRMDDKNRCSHMLKQFRSFLADEKSDRNVLHKKKKHFPLDCCWWIIKTSRHSQQQWRWCCEWFLLHALRCSLMSFTLATTDWWVRKTFRRFSWKISRTKFMTFSCPSKLIKRKHFHESINFPTRRFLAHESSELKLSSSCLDT